MTRAIWHCVVLALIAVCSVDQSRAAEHLVVQFDIPDRIECCDVTPDTCATKHPNLKVIEAKFRISAAFLEGNEASIADFDYIITSPDHRLKILDYLPNTTLESTYAQDRIEVTDATETTNTASEEAKVSYSVLSIGGSLGQSSKKSAQNHYQRVAPKALVLASGTTNRGHGVFFKLRPSNDASLEGAKEFTFLAVVPKSWRGDWCSFVCAARYHKKSLLTNHVVMAGVQSAHVGLYLCGDREGSDLSDQLCELQVANNGVLAKDLAKEAALAAENMHATEAHRIVFPWEEFTADLGKLRPGAKRNEHDLDAARDSIHQIENRLKALSGVIPTVATRP